MNATKAIMFIALTLSLGVTLTLTNIHATNSQQLHKNDDHNPLGDATTVPTSPTIKRASRFLAEEKERNPRAASHCHKDGEVCAATNTSCCNNKCVDLHTDKNNCGACKHKCKFTQKCCHGQCVMVSFDKRNCGSCGNKCKRGSYCIYGMCNYA